MMSKKSPQLRFEGFTDDWELRKLGEVYNFQYGQFNNNPDNGGQYPIYGANGIIGGYDEYNSENAIVIGHMGAYAGHVLWAEGKHFVTYNGTMGIADKSILNSNFGYYLVVSVNVPKLTAGSGQPFVSYSDLNGIKILIPTIEEQQKIGSFFKQLDNTIALHQRKLDLLKEQKKGYLQKMFPKNVAKVPELRFAGFADDWEERKLKELGDIQTGNTPPTSDSDNYSLDGVLWVTPTDIKSLVISNTAKKLSQVGVTKARIAKAGSILVTSIASIGKNTLLRMDAGFNQQINSLTPTSENDSYFLLTQSEKWSEKMKQTAASATMQIVNKTDFSNISTYVPVHKEEQEKIGSFFKQLDDTIALHQRKLDLLKEQKKGFLQKMFV